MRQFALLGVRIALINSAADALITWFNCGRLLLLIFNFRVYICRELSQPPLMDDKTNVNAANNGIN